MVHEIEHVTHQSRDIRSSSLQLGVNMSHPGLAHDLILALRSIKIRHSFLRHAELLSAFAGNLLGEQNVNKIGKYWRFIARVKTYNLPPPRTSQHPGTSKPFENHIKRD